MSQGHPIIATIISYGTNLLKTGLLALLLGLSGCGSLSGDGGWVTLIDGEKGLENFNRIGDANWRAEGGAIVKTMGDSVMAAFQHPAAALASIRTAHAEIARNARASLNREPGCRQFDVCRDAAEPGTCVMGFAAEYLAAPQARPPLANCLAAPRSRWWPTWQRWRCRGSHRSSRQPHAQWTVAPGDHHCRLSERYRYNCSA